MKKTGFTLIELMIVISLIGILSGVVLNVVNAKKQKDVATDSVNLANLEKASQGLEAYYAEFGLYPEDGSNSNPLNGTDSAKLATYLSVWPANLVYMVSSDKSDAAIYFQRMGETGYYKYIASEGKIRECGGVGSSPSACTN